MPIDDPERASDHHRLVRGIRGVRGEVTFDVRVAAPLRLRPPVPPHPSRREHRPLRERRPRARSERQPGPSEPTATTSVSHFTVRAGEQGAFLLESGADGAPTTIGHGELQTLFDDTANYWQRWVERGHYRGRWREAVYRSAITLKLMTYAPTGGLVAAPTGGLPEQVGGERNWDYRYTWVRDASFSVYALLASGFPRRGRGARQMAPGPGRGEARGTARDHSTSCTGSTAARTSSRRPSTTSTGTAARGRCASATARPTSCNSTSTASSWTPSTSPTGPASASPTPAGATSSACSTGCATTGTNPTRASGRRAAASGPSCTAGSCAGSRSIAPSASPSTGAVPPISAAGSDERDRIYEADHGQGLERRPSAPSPSTRAATCSTPRSC